MNKKLLLLVVCFAFLSLSCATSQSQFTRLTTETYPAKTDNSIIEILFVGTPTRPYLVIARLDVHLEKSHFISSYIENALPLLIVQARRSGADGIMEFKERSTNTGETKIYHVTAKAFVYTGSEN